MAFTTSIPRVTSPKIVWFRSNQELLLGGNLELAPSVVPVHIKLGEKTALVVLVVHSLLVRNGVPGASGSVGIGTTPWIR